MDLQNQWNLHIKQKANQYIDQSYSECVWCVFLQDFTKHVDSKIAPKTRAIVNIDMLFYMNNACMSHSNLIFMHCLLNWSGYFVYYKTVLDTHLNAIGHFIVCFVFDMLISLRLKIQSLSLLWSSCENFRPLAEAKCHTVWKMIVVVVCMLSYFNRERFASLIVRNCVIMTFS